MGRLAQTEGLTDIQQEIPDWTVWTGPVPGGETAEQVGARTDEVIAQVRARSSPTPTCCASWVRGGSICTRPRVRPSPWTPRRFRRWVSSIPLR